MARKSKLTPELITDLAGAIRDGLYLDQACHAVGISTSTYYYWQKDAANEDGNPLAADLVEEVDRARAEVERELVTVVREAASKDWKAAVWFLQHAFPDRWQGEKYWNQALRDPSPPPPSDDFSLPMFDFLPRSEI